MGLSKRRKRSKATRRPRRRSVDGDGGDSPAWKIPPKVIEPLALLLAHGSPATKARTVPFEFAHELNESSDTVFRKRVVNRRPHAADRAVAFQTVQSGYRRFLLEQLFELFVREPEGDVHQ